MGRLELISNVSEYKKFKELYDDAVKKNLTEFIWYSSPVLVAYAKYALQYYKPKFGGIK